MNTIRKSGAINEKNAEVFEKVVVEREGPNGEEDPVTEVLAKSGRVGSGLGKDSA